MKFGQLHAIHSDIYYYTEQAGVLLKLDGVNGTTVLKERLKPEKHFMFEVIHLTP